MLRTRYPRLAGNGGALALVVAFIVLTVTSALVVTNLYNSQRATNEYQSQAAIAAARAGLNQFVADLEDGMAANPMSLSDNDPDLCTGLSFYSGSTDPFQYADQAVKSTPPKPYPLPNQAYSG
ncbi:MAG TPA: hypothetical protein VGO93_25935, partial [Candidatus Xenobia bacterium]